MRNPDSGDCAAVDLDSDGVRRWRTEPPPPMSWLARAEDLSSHVPWVMRRYHTSDGRLVIKEERVKRRDYFLADRSNGRLVLNLVHVDDADEEESAEAAIDAGDDEGKSDLTVEEVAFKYAGVGLKPACGGFVPVVPVYMPPVHT